MEAFDMDKQLILVLDDDTDDIQLAKDCLNNDDFHVLGMTNPHRALELAQHLLPSVMLVDVLMPQRNGWDVLKEMRANPATAHIPVILWSVTDSHGFHQELGAVDYLLKPVKREQLVEAVQRAVASP
jgi:CheY-like chemotaxis protein